MKLADWIAAQDPPVKPVDFARRVEIDPSMMSRLLSGARKPSLELAARIEQETGGAVGLRDWTSAPPEGGEDPAGDEPEEGASSAERSAA